MADNVIDAANGLLPVGPQARAEPAPNNRYPPVDPPAAPGDNADHKYVCSHYLTTYTDDRSSQVFSILLAPMDVVAAT